MGNKQYSKEWNPYSCQDHRAHFLTIHMTCNLRIPVHLRQLEHEVTSALYLPYVVLSHCSHSCIAIMTDHEHNQEHEQDFFIPVDQNVCFPHGLA